MRTVSPWVLFSSLALLSLVACAPGEGTGDGGPDGGAGCEEMCDGDTLIECDEDGNEVETDCSVDFAGCSDVSGEFACEAEVGASCLEDGVLAACQGTEPGCLDDATNELVCVEDVGTCSDADERTCDGTVLTAECTGDQPFNIDCAAYAGTCSDGEGCISVADGFCDDFDFFCEDGLTCTNNTCS